jgi:hypothetical protein
MSWIRFTLAGVILLTATVYFGLPPGFSGHGSEPVSRDPKFGLAGKRALVDGNLVTARTRTADMRRP